MSALCDITRSRYSDHQKVKQVESWRVKSVFLCFNAFLNPQFQVLIGSQSQSVSDQKKKKLRKELPVDVTLTFRVAAAAAPQETGTLWSAAAVG